MSLATDAASPKSIQWQRGFHSKKKMPFSIIPFPVRIIVKPIFTFWNMCIADLQVAMVIKNSQVSFIIFLSNRMHTDIVRIEYKAFSSSIWVQLNTNGGSDDKDSACFVGDPDSVSGSGRSLENGMATHTSILAWRISWTEEPAGLQSTESQRVWHDWATNSFYEYDIDFIFSKKIKYLSHSSRLLIPALLCLPSDGLIWNFLSPCCHRNFTYSCWRIFFCLLRILRVPKALPPWEHLVQWWISIGPIIYWHTTKHKKRKHHCWYLKN